MWRLPAYLGWIFAGGCFGLFASTVLASAWNDLTRWHFAAAGWLTSIGLPGVAGYVPVVWLRIPDWLIVGLVGIAIALYVSSRPLMKVVLFSLAFELIPWLVSIILIGLNPFEHGTTVFLHLLLSTLSVVAVGAATVISINAVRSRLKNDDRKGFDVPSAR